MSAAFEIRPWPLGTQVDVAVRLWRSRFRDFLVLSLGLQVANYALLKAMDAVHRHFVGGDVKSTLTALLKGTDPSLAQNLLLASGVDVALTVASVLVAFVWTIPVAAIALGELRGQPLSAAGALSSVTDAARPLLSLLLRSFGLIAVVSLAAFAPAALMFGAALLTDGLPRAIATLCAAGFGALAVLFVPLWMVIRFYFLGPVFAGESLAPAAALKRTGALSSGRVEPGPLGVVKLRLSVVISVVGTVLVIIGLLGNAPSLVLHLVYGSLFDFFEQNSSAVPVWLLVPAELFGLVVSAIFSALYVTMAVAAYADIRARREAFDIELALERAS